MTGSPPSREPNVEPERAAGQVVSAIDDRFLHRAVELGRRGWGRVHPNPMVGCVIVRGDEIVGEGWHQEYGGPHAEQIALSAAGESAKGATAYVSLEPCRHQGKTPACTTALRDAGIRRLVFGALDPGRESGGGAEDLRASGLEVVGPILTERRARIENPGFFHACPERPWVSLKLAVSLDGRISAAQGTRSRISGPEADDRVQWLRAGFDAILVGTRTVLVDDPRLTVRGRVCPRIPPRRVVLDAKGRISASARMLREGAGSVSFFTTAASSESWRRSIQNAGGGVVEVERGDSGGVSLPAVLASLRADGVCQLLCEGGGRLAASLLRERLVDRLYLVVAPRLLGPAGAPAFSWGDQGSRASRTREARPAGEWEWIEEPRRLGRDIWTVLERGEG